MTERPGVDLTPSIVDRLQPSTALLVLDSCEHVVDAAARLAARLLMGCPEVRLLATSRERLGLTDERLITVPPLASVPSVTLCSPSEPAPWTPRSTPMRTGPQSRTCAGRCAG